jgi:hypothetical protein
MVVSRSQPSFSSRIDSIATSAPLASKSGRAVYSDRVCGAHCTRRPGILANLLVPGNELRRDRLLQQFRWKQTLAEKEVVKGFLIELDPQGELRSGSEFANFHITIEIGGGLPWRFERIAVDPSVRLTLLGLGWFPGGASAAPSESMGMQRSLKARARKREMTWRFPAGLIRAFSDRALWGKQCRLRSLVDHPRFTALWNTDI